MHILLSSKVAMKLIKQNGNKENISRFKFKTFKDVKIKQNTKLKCLMKITKIKIRNSIDEQPINARGIIMNF